MKEGTTYSLILDSAALEDHGVYTCIAKNAGGEVLCKAELIVHEGNLTPWFCWVDPLATAFVACLPLTAAMLYIFFGFWKCARILSVLLAQKSEKVLSRALCNDLFFSPGGTCIEMSSF